MAHERPTVYDVLINDAGSEVLDCAGQLRAGAAPRGNARAEGCRPDRKQDEQRSGAHRRTGGQDHQQPFGWSWSPVLRSSPAWPACERRVFACASAAEMAGKYSGTSAAAKAA